jgi:hypothetical protein
MSDPFANMMIDPKTGQLVPKAGTAAAASSNSWVSANAANVAKYPGQFNAISAPADMDAFRQNFGGGYAKESDYNNWRLGQQRERTLGDFVNRMATSDPARAQYNSQMQGDYDKYRGNLDAYLKAPTPKMDTSNRFEAGLSANERRLNALLEDPEAVRKTAAYKFRLKQGEDAIQRQMGARGLLNSGNRLMELTKYGQDMGSQEYDAQAGRLSNLVGMYSGNWISDKNANTQKYAAESNAWNQRGGLLKDIYGQAQQGVTNAAKIGADDRVQWGNVWVNQAPKAQQYSIAQNF